MMNAATKAFFQTAGIALLVVIAVNVANSQWPTSKKITHPL